jgi:hypothetical protein
MHKADMNRWKQRKGKSKPKPKTDVHRALTEHALQRSEQRGVRVKDVVEGRAAVRQLTTEDGRFITIVPIIAVQCKAITSPAARRCTELC